MVEQRSDDLDLIFHALSDPTRRALLRSLALNRHKVTRHAEPFDMSLAAVSKHLKVLEKAKLITRTKAGRIHRFRVNTGVLESASRWIVEYEKFWNSRLDALEKFLGDQAAKDRGR